jgi:hypothetical protein
MFTSGLSPANEDKYARAFYRRVICRRFMHGKVHSAGKTIARNYVNEGARMRMPDYFRLPWGGVERRKRQRWSLGENDVVDIDARFVRKSADGDSRILARDQSNANAGSVLHVARRMQRMQSCCSHLLRFLR